MEKVALYGLGAYTIEELQAEIDSRATANRLTGEIVFEFAGKSKAESWASVGIDELSTAGDASTFVLGEPVVLSDHSVTVPFQYTAIGASKTDVARFCVRTAGLVLAGSGNQRLHPNGFQVRVSDVERVPARRIRVHQQ